jgi:hypothetical protein
VASGVPLPAVSARLGHGSIRTTQEIYSHMIHGRDDEAARKWEEFQNQPTGGEPQQKGACSEAVRDRVPAKVEAHVGSAPAFAFIPPATNSPQTHPQFRLHSEKHSSAVRHHPSDFRPVVCMNHAPTRTCGRCARRADSASHKVFAPVPLPGRLKGAADVRRRR